MAQRSFAMKMLLIGAIFSLPVTLLIVLLYLAINSDVSFYRLERVGVAYTRTLRPLFADLEAYRLQRYSGPAQATRKKRIGIDFEVAVNADAGWGRSLGLTNSLRTLHMKWLDGERVDGVLDDFVLLLGLVSDNSKITLDPILDGYYVGDTMVNKVPALIDSAAQIGFVGRRTLQTASLRTADRIAMTILLGQVQTARQGIDHNLTIAMGTEPYLRSTLQSHLARERAATTTFETWLGAHLLEPKTPHGSPSALTAFQTDTLESAFALYDAAIAEMDDVLNRRVDALIRREVIILTIVLLAVMSAAALMILTTRSMSRHLADKVSLQHEIVGRIKVEERLAFAAFHDELTGLSNRALLMDRLNHIGAKRQAQTHFWALIFLDLDRFKVVNDSLGHRAGDLVLIEASRRLQTCVRVGDTLARLGGDEFVILLDEIDDVDLACIIAERVLGAFEAPFLVAGHEVFTSASIGIATSSSAQRPDDVLRNADIAMYSAKQLGKQRYELFTPELLTNAVLRLELETDLAHALERQEFCLFYQPLISVREGRLAGFERSFAGDILDVACQSRRLITIAEENGAIVPIGEWILDEACRQMRAWQCQFPSVEKMRININVSAKQLKSAGFVTAVQSALERSGLAANSVNIEITESVLVESGEHARTVLKRMRELGIQIHLDDFGTGYSSLSYLREFPIDSLKIDRSFVSKAGDDESSGLASAEIVRTIIDLARSLSLTVTAEGTETAAQAQALCDLGCTNLQGFHFSRPVEASAATAFISTAATFLWSEVPSPALSGA